jgi:hypothetical protein
MDATSIDNLPGFRRRFRITPAPGVVCGEVEDDYHCMSVTVCHLNGVTTCIRPVLERAPWSTCPGAVDQLKRTFSGLPLAAYAERGRRRENCTHLHDLATLAAIHAFDTEQLVYDILVTDPLDARREVELRRNAEVMFRWTMIDGCIVEPSDLHGLTLDKLNPWIASLDVHRQEAARLLRWGAMIANGRTIPLERQSDASRMPPNCYTFQPDRSVHARRVGVIRDFAPGAAQPLQPSSSIKPAHQSNSLHLPAGELT